MPDRDDLTPPPLPRIVLNYHEREARRTLMLAAGKLSAIRADLWNLHINLEITDAEETAIEEGEQAESLAYALRGAIECVNRDSLDGAIKTLEEAALMSITNLLSEWQERKKRQTSRGEETSE